MWIDGDTVATGTELNADVCIIGCGPAGITVARELAPTGASIVVLDSGSFEQSPAADALNESEYAGDFGSPGPTRRRQVGGMAAAWNTVLIDGAVGARYLPLDGIDFEQRDWVPHSGWPISLDDLTPFYERAHVHCGLGSFAGSASCPTESDRPVLATPSGRMISRLDQLGPASRFTDHAAAELRSSRTVTLVTGATVNELRSDGLDASTVRRARVDRAGGGSFSVNSRFLRHRDWRNRGCTPPVGLALGLGPRPR